MSLMQGTTVCVGSLYTRNEMEKCLICIYAFLPFELGLVLSSFAQSLYYVAIYITICTPAFRVPPLLLLMQQ